ncbi:zincin-like metallopeptidase domain-containing protein [Roseovarius sp. 217]|nr:zincin-like metallopeptidase domain-containing protein [Roseovarius sp. 217]
MAKLGAAFCCAKLDITSEPRLGRAQCLENWLQALNYCPKAVLKASAFAQ